VAENVRVVVVVVVIVAVVVVAVEVLVLVLLVVVLVVLVKRRRGGLMDAPSPEIDESELLDKLRASSLVNVSRFSIVSIRFC
jgi:hypothetical protein